MFSFFYSLAEKVTKAFSLLDRALLKIILVVVGLLIAKFFPTLTSYHRGYYVTVILIVEAYFIRKIWGQKR